MTSGALDEVAASPRDAENSPSNGCPERASASVAELTCQGQKQPRSCRMRNGLLQPSAAVRSPPTASLLVAGLSLLIALLHHLRIASGDKFSQAASSDDAFLADRNDAGKWGATKFSADGHSDLAPDLLSTLIFSLIQSPSVAEKEDIAMQTSAHGNLARDGLSEVKTIENAVKPVRASSFLFSVVWDLNQLFDFQRLLPGKDALVGFAFGLVFALAIYARVNRFAAHIVLDQHFQEGQLPLELNQEVDAVAELLGTDWMQAAANDECPWGAQT
jgi:hypothetical protein